MGDLFKLMITQRKQVYLTTKPSSLAWQQSPETEVQDVPPNNKKMVVRGPHPAQWAQRISDPEDVHTQERAMCDPSLTCRDKKNVPAQPGGGAGDGSTESARKDTQVLSLLLTRALITEL